MATGEAMAHLRRLEVEGRAVRETARRRVAVARGAEARLGASPAGESARREHMCDEHTADDNDAYLAGRRRRRAVRRCWPARRG